MRVPTECRPVFLSSLARFRRVVATVVLVLFLGVLLVQTLGEALLPELGLTQPGMLLAAVVAGGGALYFTLLAILVALALVLGRVFCSWLCPLGILQDVAGRFFHGRSGQSKKKRGHRYSRGTLWRYAVPLLLAGSLFGLGPWLYGLAEPYSLFARSVQSVGQPVYAAFFNAVALTGEASGAFLLPVIPFHLDGVGLALALPLLFLVLYLAYTRGRGYCNSVCPVGALLGLAGGAALLRPRFTAACTACGLCEGTCKAHCLDGRNGHMDGSRCVACYNCLEACPFDGLTLAPAQARRSLSESEDGGTPDSSGIEARDAMSAKARREHAPTARKSGFMPERALFLRGAASIGALLLLQPVSRMAGEVFSLGRGKDARFPGPEREGLSGAGITPDFLSGEGIPEPVASGSIPHVMPVLPPGADSLSRFESRCTGCHTCISACPPGVLTVSGPFVWERSGIARMALPGMDFFRAFCQAGCTRCTEVCPTGALVPVELERKKRLQLGQAVFVESLCIIVTKKTRCGACAEHCPTGALIMAPPPGGGADLPRIDRSLCIGCGACQYACPVRPVQAVEVFALAEHGTAAPPRERKKDIDAGEEFPF